MFQADWQDNSIAGGDFTVPCLWEDLGLVSWGVSGFGAVGS